MRIDIKIEVGKTYRFIKSGNLVRVNALDRRKGEAGVERIDSGKGMIVPIRALIAPDDPLFSPG